MIDHIIFSALEYMTGEQRETNTRTTSSSRRSFQHRWQSPTMQFFILQLNNHPLLYRCNTNSIGVQTKRPRLTWVPLSYPVHSTRVSYSTIFLSNSCVESWKMRCLIVYASTTPTTLAILSPQLTKPWPKAYSTWGDFAENPSGSLSPFEGIIVTVWHLGLSFGSTSMDMEISYAYQRWQDHNPPNCSVFGGRQN